MVSSSKVVSELQKLLGSELTGIKQYMAQHEIIEAMGFRPVSKILKCFAMDEMKHAHRLIERIIFLEGTPDMNGGSPVKLIMDIEQVYKNTLANEQDAVDNYNSAIALAADAKDSGTAEDLEKILHDEERHVEKMTERLAAIKKIGIDAWLATKVD